jgi:hypothetical protein
MFEREQKYYEEHREQLRDKYLGRHIVIYGEEVIGVYDTVGEAYRETAKTLRPGSFMIKEIRGGLEDEVISLSPFVYG